MSRPFLPVRTLIAWAAATACSAGFAQAVQQLEPVEVISTTPLPGSGLRADQIPANVQTVRGRDIERSGALDASDYLLRRMGSVNINSVQGNPLQNDLNFRGYTASPLLGTPQGLSVWLDGVRMNQPFGDVVSWDLIPRKAISTMTLMPGANPVFGLNTLGGALVLTTKDGRSAPGTEVSVGVGSWERVSVDVEHGGSNDAGLHWYGAARAFREKGWRDDSPSRQGQVFGKLGWHDAATDVAVSLSAAETRLTGNGLQEQALLAADWKSIYTKPDITRNRSLGLNLTATHELSPALTLSGNAYWRRLRTGTTNGDINEDSLDQAVYQPSPADQAALAAAGYTGFPTAGADASNTPFPFWRCIAQALQADEPAEKCNGVINTTSTSQTQRGVSAQLAWKAGGKEGVRQQFVGGVSFDASRLHFTQGSELGYLNPDRGVTGVGAFGDGVTGGDVDGEPYDTRVDLAGRVRSTGAYAMHTVTLDDALHLTLAGRYNRTTVSNVDAITPAGTAGTLTADHAFSRFNPALGVSWSPTKTFNAYVGYSESSRAPTTIELGCADPANPCKLPNAMAGDPPLKQVVAKSIELGARGRFAGLRWNAGVYRIDNRDDILFVADDAAGFGYFKNFGKTRRQGLEAGLSGRTAGVDWYAQYTFIDATFRSAELVNGSSNSSNESAEAGLPGIDGEIEIRPGDRMPLIPRHMLKLGADIGLGGGWSLDLGMVAVAGSLARGNENGLHEPDGTIYSGPGRSAGYAVFNLGASVEVAKGFTLTARIDNLFDRRYATAAQLGPNGIQPDGSFIARPFAPVTLPDGSTERPLRHSTFYAPGAPRALFVGASYRF